jgi:hypothetical protein
MNKFLSRIFLFFFIIFWVLVLHLIITRDSNGYHDVIKDKHSILNDRLGSSIILVGGSNLAFGILSKEIEDFYGIDVVNSSIAGGYGLKFIIDDIRPFIRESDVVILVPEYEHFFNNDYFGSSISLHWVIEAFPQSLFSFNTKQLRFYLEQFPLYYKEKIKQTKSILNKSNDPLIYKRSGFESHGDFVGHWGRSNPNKLSLSKLHFEDEINLNSLLGVLEFNEFLENKGARLLISYPSYEEKSFKKDSVLIKKLDDKLRSLGLIVISRPESFVYSRDLFFDTRYHLNQIGQRRRTNDLISDLRRYLNLP